MESNNYQSCLHHANDSNSIQSTQTKGVHNADDIKSYKRRFWMLFLFSTLAMLSGLLFPQHTSMTDVTMCFYHVNIEAVSWTGMIFMVVYIVLVFPGMWLMGKIGLKRTITIGSACNTISVALQFAILSPDNFPYVMVSAFFGSLANVFILGVPPYLAAIWFPSEEVSRACAAGVFGNQLGSALSYVFFSHLISDDCSKKDLIAEGKRNVAIILTCVNGIVLLLIIFTFQKGPKLPPSTAQAQKEDTSESFLHSALLMAKNVHFVLVFITYGLVVGSYYAIATLANTILLSYFSISDVMIGWLGLEIIATGLVGSIIAGFILDYTHKFKETSICICFLSFFSYIIFSCLLNINKLWLQFITVGTFGFFLTSYLPVGFEYGIEVTYPESEHTSAGLLNSATMIFGIIITEIASNVAQNVGPHYANIVMCVALFIASIISCFITREYKRSKSSNIDICMSHF